MHLLASLQPRTPLQGTCAQGGGRSEVAGAPSPFRTPRMVEFIKRGSPPLASETLGLWVTCAPSSGPTGGEVPCHPAIAPLIPQDTGVLEPVRAGLGRVARLKPHMVAA